MSFRAGSTRTPGSSLHAGREPNSSTGRSPREWAHPCTQGENQWRLIGADLHQGSSLHAGREQGRRRDRADPEGLIPARRARTSWASRPATSPWAHPSTQGENNLSDIEVTGQGGSSLHAGREQVGAVSSFRECGLIPARRARTCGESGRFRALRAHPCTQGENSSSCRMATSSSGSSLHAGREPRQVLPAGELHGLIPARRARTRRLGASSGDRRAHPCTQGENDRMRRLGCMAGGSSLHAGREPNPATRRPSHFGLIPARRARTGFRSVRRLRVRAHPCTQGENSEFLLMQGATGGSSLHAGREPLLTRDLVVPTDTFHTIWASYVSSASRAFVHEGVRARRPFDALLQPVFRGL